MKKTYYRYLPRGYMRQYHVHKASTGAGMATWTLAGKN